MGSFRLPTGGAIDRTRPVRFSFDGRAYSGCEGDTLASALLANGVGAISRSFKFRRPRGIYSCGIEEPSALVQLGTGGAAIPSARATLVPLREGIEAFSQSGWPSVRTDMGRLLDCAASLWAAGFYNKAFMWPGWSCYEWLIRRLSGLGRVPSGPDPDRYETCNLHCDVLVVGGGVAGLSAATAAGKAGARVLLAEQRTSVGGQGAWDGSTIESGPTRSWIAATARLIEDLPNVQVLTQTVAFGYYDHEVVALIETPASRGQLDSSRPLEGKPPRERCWLVRARRVVLATGAIEQPLVFDNNDRPGVMLAGAAREYLRRHAVAPGHRVLVATNNDSAYATARDLVETGVEVAGLLDSRHEPPASLMKDMDSLAIRSLPGAMPVDTHGLTRIKGVSFGRLSADSRSIRGIERLACDAIVISGGLNPALQLYAQAGAKLAYSEATGALAPSSALAAAVPVGAAAGIVDTDAAIRHAAAIGEQAAAAMRGSPASHTPALETQRPGIRVSPVGRTRRQWVDLRHDVTVADLELAVRENYTSIEHVKRYTTVGMSVDQGKTSNVLAIEIVARLEGKRPAELGHTTLRPPFTPVTLGAIAGRDIGAHFAPSRRLPTHDWHVAQGAALEDFGEWRRPAVYPLAGEERAKAVKREARGVRMSAGLMDASSLGKIEVHGPDAREFLDRFYINDLRTLQPGRVRYGFMLRESGVIFDDGTIVMLGADHFLITTTSAHSQQVAAWLEEWRQCQWPQLRVAIVPVTDQWANLSLAGRCARDILSRLRSDIDLSEDAFPHMAIREGSLLGQRARIYRVSFSGELTYEINVPAGAAQTIWDALMAAGAPFGLQAFGLDALSLMRLEMGYILVGSDTDGTTIPDDIGWGKAAAAKGRDFIGKRSLQLPHNVRLDRHQLVGLMGVDGQSIAAGSHLRLPDSTQTTDGWVTSAGRSVLTDEPIALAMISAGRERLGATVSVHDLGRVTHARIVNPPFFDPRGSAI